MDIRDKAFKVVQYVYNSGQMNPGNTSWSDFCYGRVDEIHALYTVPSIWLPCDECGGNGSIPNTAKAYASGYGPLTVPHDPCTCTKGKREWRVHIQRECVVCGYDHFHDCPVCNRVNNKDKPLHATDLFDADVAYTYHGIVKLAEYTKLHTIEVTEGNNKGRLILKPVEGE